MQHPNLAENYVPGFDYDAEDADARQSVVTFRNASVSAVKAVAGALCGSTTYESTRLEVYDNIIFGLLSQVDTFIGVPAP